MSENRHENNQETIDNNKVSKKIELSKKKLIISLILLIAIGSGGYFAYQELTEEEVVVEEELPLVEVDRPKEKNMEKQTTLIGNVDPTDNRVVVPEVSGEAENIYVEKGDHVEEGDLLMELDDEDYRLQLQEARAGVDGTRSKLQEAKEGARTGKEEEAKTSVERARDAKEQMERELERVERLYEEGYASEQELEQVELRYSNAEEQLNAAEGFKDTVEEGAREDELDALRAQVDRAETGVQLAQNMVERTQVTAPSDGEIIMVDTEEGELVGSESPAFAVLDTESFQVVAGLPETYVNQVNEGDQVELSIPSAKEETFSAMIHYIGQVPPEKEGGSGYPVEIDLEQELEEKVRSGMYSRVNVTLEESEQALVIPQHAIIEEGGETGVYTVDKKSDNQEVEFNTVETGINQDSYKEIVSGIEKEEYVVLEGFEEIVDGTEVEAVRMGDDS